MMNPVDLEAAYQEYINDLKRFVPDGVIEVDLNLLQELGLLSSEEGEEEDLTQNFYVVESTDKLTLFNQRFAIWIVPKMVDNTPTTFTLIAQNEKEKPRLEMVFAATGVYNHSSLVLRILERFLEQIEENEKEICRYHKK